MSSLTTPQTGTRSPGVPASSQDSTSSHLVRTLRAEWRRARTGRHSVNLAAGAIALCLLTSYSLAARAQSGNPGDTPSSLVEGQVRAWMMTFLLAAIFGSMLATRDLRTGALTRAVLAASRGTVFAAKAAVSVVAGLGFGLLAAAMAVGSTLAIDNGLGVEHLWTAEATKIVIGVVACCVLASVFGLFVGILVRSGTVALLVLLLQTLLIEPGLQRLVPDVAKFLFTISLSSVYRDVLPDLLPLWAGAVVALAWVSALGVAAWLIFNRKDITTS